MASATVQTRSKHSNPGEKSSESGFSPKAKTQDNVTCLKRPIVPRHAQNIIQRTTACPCGGGCPACVAARSIAPSHKPVQLGRNLPVQASLKVGAANDSYEQEADRVADTIMRMPSTSNIGAGQASDISIQRTCAPCAREYAAVEKENRTVRRSALCPKCARESEKIAIQRKPESAGSDLSVPSNFVSSLGAGRPLDPASRSFFEPRFGRDFGDVRIHSGPQAAESASSINARAYTMGNNVVFGAGEYQPGTSAGQRLLAHELTHVVQQGGTSRFQLQRINENNERQALINGIHMGMTNHLVQRLPGDGMVPPGDCSWVEYIVLRGSVETAKAVVSTLGACSPGDSCVFLAAKIAAITAEIAARVALDATCFKGGDTGHRQQIQDKINMMNRCYRFFSNSNCSPELIAAMAVVVEKAREVIAAASVAVAIVLIIALIAALIALWEVIAALAAAVAEALALEEAAVAMAALLNLLMRQLAVR